MCYMFTGWTGYSGASVNSKLILGGAKEEKRGNFQCKVFHEICGLSQKIDLSRKKWNECYN